MWHATGLTCVHLKKLRKIKNKNKNKNNSKKPKNDTCHYSWPLMI